MATIHSPEHFVVDMLEWHIKVRDDFFGRSQNLIKLVGKELRVAVKNPNPVNAFDFGFESLEQVGETGLAVKVDAVIGHVLGYQNQFFHSVSGEFLRFPNDFFDRFGHVLATHTGNGAERAKPVTAFGYLQVSKVSWGNSEAGGVFLGTDRGGLEQGSLFVETADDSVCSFGDFFASKDTHHLINSRLFLK